MRADSLDPAPVEWPRLGRIAAVTTLVLGATLQVVAFATIPSHDDTSDRLQRVADHESQAQVSKIFDELAIPFFSAPRSCTCSCLA